MIPNSARYLLRVDDLCPTLNREPWRRLAVLIEKHGLNPILAVVPDNRDRDLRVSNPDESFWEQMRAMQRAGAAIALHGYQHRASSRGRSLVPLHRASEFAGISAMVQRTWIRAGIQMLRAHGLNPTIWVAPRHGFDRHTLEALRSEEVLVLSDSFARRPFTRGGMTWIPQQLWAPLEKRTGLWTICLHPNTLTAAQFDHIAAFVREHHSQFTSVDKALAEFPPSQLTLPERLREQLAYARFAASGFTQRMKRRFWGELDRTESLRQPVREPCLPAGFSPPATCDTELRADRARSRD